MLATRLIPRPEILLLSVALFWGTSYAVAQQAVSLYAPIGFLAVRFGLTTLLLLPILWRHPGALRLGLPLGFLLWAIFLTETLGITLTSASHAAFLISLCVVLTPWCEGLLTRQWPTLEQLGTAGLCLVGAALLIEPGTHLNPGDGLILLAALLRAILLSLSRRWLQNTTQPQLAITAAQSLVVACASLTLALLLGDPPPPLRGEFWLACGYLVLFCTLFALGVQNLALQHLSASRVALLMAAEPLFGAVFSMLYRGESMTALNFLGGLLIAIAPWLGLSRPKPLTLTPDKTKI